MIFGFSMIIIAITLSVGYSTLVKASGQKGSLKSLGKVIAWLIIVIAILGILCAGFNTLGCKKGKSFGRGHMRDCPKELNCPHCKKQIERKEICPKK